MSDLPKIDIKALEGELSAAKEKLEMIDPSLRAKPESLSIVSQITKIKNELKKADPVKHEKLNLILKCECGNTAEIHPELQAKLDNDEDISSSIPSCECGKSYHISVTH